MTSASSPKMLTPAQVAQFFAVDAKTVSRWAKTGKLPYIRTLGGHRRFSSAVIDEMLAKQNEPE